MRDLKSRAQRLPSTDWRKKKEQGQRNRITHREDIETSERVRKQSENNKENQSSGAGKSGNGGREHKKLRNRILHRVGRGLKVCHETQENKYTIVLMS